MGELLLRKIVLCRDRIHKLRAAEPTSPEEILIDERTEAFIAFHLFLLVQDAIDLAAHLIADRGLGVPSSQREAFEMLAKAGLVSPASAQAMAQMAALRNRIAHSYGDLDPVRMVREMPSGLEAVSRFLDEVTLLQT